MIIWVKGKAQDCIDAAAERNIPLIGYTHCHPTVVQAVVDAQYQKEVIQWYAERSEIVEGKGYSVGTLLFHTL